MRVNDFDGREGINSEEHCWEGINLGFFKHDYERIGEEGIHK